jgi:hypothetical protein
LPASGVYHDWVTSGIFAKARSVFQGLFEQSGLFNTEPEAVSLSHLLNETLILESDRYITTGATSLNTGLYTLFNTTTESALNAALASSAGESLL